MLDYLQLLARNDDMLVVGVRLRHLCHKYVEGHEEPPMPDYLQLPCTNYLSLTEVSRSMPTADTEKKIAPIRGCPKDGPHRDLASDPIYLSAFPVATRRKKVGRSKLP